MGLKVSDAEYLQCKSHGGEYSSRNWSPPGCGDCVCCIPDEKPTEPMVNGYPGLGQGAADVGHFAQMRGYGAQRGYGGFGHMNSNYGSGSLGIHGRGSGSTYMGQGSSTGYGSSSYGSSSYSSYGSSSYGGYGSSGGFRPRLYRKRRTISKKVEKPE